MKVTCRISKTTSIDPNYLQVKVWVDQCYRPGCGDVERPTAEAYCLAGDERAAIRSALTRLALEFSSTDEDGNTLLPFDIEMAVEAAAYVAWTGTAGMGITPDAKWAVV